MNGQDNQVDIPDFQQDIPVEENQRRNFVAAMIQARDENAPIQVFQNLLNDAPPVSVETLYDLANGFLSHTNVVQMLLEHEPKIARHKDPHVGLLLHQAISSHNTPVEIIELILDAYPEAISEYDINGMLPFHLAYEHGRCLRTAELLFSRFPDAASVSYRDQNGRQFPLHSCLRNYSLDRSDEFIMALIEAYPTAASIKTRHNWTALHGACQIGFSLAIIQRLYQLYPEAVSVQADGWIPLRFACQAQQYFAPPLEVIKFLLEKHPEGAQSRGARDGRLPLHVVLEMQAIPVELVQMLIKAYPNAVNVTDHNGKLPLHTACCYGPSLEVIQLLLDDCVGDEHHHNGLSIADNSGSLPIHWYVRSRHARPDTLQHLLDLYPEGIRAVDNVGLLPLHHACQSYLLILGIIRILVEEAPYTVIQKSIDGRTPLQFAFGRGFAPRRNFGVMEYLLERQNEAVNAMKEAFTNVASVQLGLPDLVIANVWSFAKPDLWTPAEEDWIDDSDY